MSLCVARQNDVFNIWHKKPKGSLGDVATLSIKCIIDNNKILFEQFMYVSQNKIFSVLINGIMSSFQHHARKILMYFNNPWLVETKKGRDNRMKAADVRYSICPYISIASYKKIA